LWITGQWLGIDGFDSEDDLAEQRSHVTAMNAAARQDRKIRKESGLDSLIL